MSYLPHTSQDVQHMCQAVGVADVDELLRFIPENLRLGRSLNLPEPLSEYELLQLIEQMSRENCSCARGTFLGAGAYRHFIPSIVNTVIERSEFLTAYTPYQAEASQGTLQAIFEFQTMICRLTGMDVANASVYDGGTAAVDALIMAANKTRRQKVLVSRAVNPQIRQVIATYLAGSKIVVEDLPMADGCTDMQSLREAVNKEVAAVLVQIPNFLGLVEDGPALAQAVHEAGALLAVSVGDAVSLGLLEAPGKYGADLVCGDGQGIGLPLSFGGPYLGYLACTKALMRNIPGRLVGMTEDHNGKRGFCLTLQAREQHIRREMAASNICSNQGLCALAATVHLALLGPRGFRQASVSSLRAAHKLHRQLTKIKGLQDAFTGSFFNEFVLRLPQGRLVSLSAHLRKQGIVGGYELGHDYPELADCLLVCATELTSDADIDNYVKAVEAWSEEVCG